MVNNTYMSYNPCVNATSRCYLHLTCCISGIDSSITENNTLYGWIPCINATGCCYLHQMCCISGKNTQF